MLSWSKMLVGFQGAFVSAMALTLLHSLWQGTIIGLLGLALDARSKRASPNIRCGAFSLLLLTLFALWVGTFCYLYGAQTHRSGMTTGGVSIGAYHWPLVNINSVITGDTNDLSTVPSRLSVLQSVFLPLVACWVLGVCLLSLRHIGGFLLLNRMSRIATIPYPPAWEDCMVRLATRMGIRRRIRLCCSTGIDVPFAFGLFRSSILLPFSLMTGLAPEQVEALIAHELAHLARHDVLLNLIQVCVETILFYHPVVRWISAQIRAAREQHCDDLAIQVIGDRALYARALYSLEESRASIPQLALGAKGANSDMTNTHLIRRIRRVLGVSVPDRRDPWIKGALTLGVATLGLATVLPVRAHSLAPGDNPSGTPSASQTTQAQGSGSVSIQLDINGDKFELHSTSTTQDTLVAVNGKEIRFGDLTQDQQQQLQKALKNVSISTSSMSTGPHGTTYQLEINGDKIELHSTNLTPETRVTVNGKESRFGDLTPTQQQHVQKAMTGASASSSSKSPLGETYQLDINGEKVELHSASLTPDTPITVNGKKTRFGDLNPQQQQLLENAMMGMSASTSSMSVSTGPKGTMFQLEFNGDKIELHSTNLTPDTPLTVNGKEGRFGDLTQDQQQQLQNAMKNVSVSTSSSATTPTGP